MMKAATTMLLMLATVGCGLLGSGEDDPFLPGKIVFSAPDTSGNNQIFTMNADGSGLRQLTVKDFEYGPGDDERDFNGHMPAWSPDGNQIVFSSFYKATSSGLGLWIMNADGDDIRPLYDPEPDNPHVPYLAGNNPRWSPDGTQIAFDLCVNCQISTNYAIFVFDRETETLNRLTEESEGYQSSYPTWSPDGTQIAFASNRDYVDAEIERYRKDLYIMKADGSDQRRVTKIGNVDIPTWQSNGSLIAYASQHVEREVFLFNQNTNEVQQLTDLKHVGRPIWKSGSELLVPGTTNNGDYVLQYIDTSGNILQEIPMEIEDSKNFDLFAKDDH